jgi:hypothetical protein
MPSTAARPAQRERRRSVVGLAEAAVGDGQHRGPIGRASRQLVLVSNGAVGDQQQAVAGIDRLGGFLDAAGKSDRQAVAAETLEGGSQGGGHALDQDKDRRGAGGRG